MPFSESLTLVVGQENGLWPGERGDCRWVAVNKLIGATAALKDLLLPSTLFGEISWRCRWCFSSEGWDCSSKESECGEELHVDE